MSAFSTTRWSQVLALGQPGPEADAALSDLCRRYRAPVLAFVRASGIPGPHVEDLTQAFFVHLIERGTSLGADPARGRFRNWLLGALRHFLADAADHARAARRGGAQAHEDLDNCSERLADAADARPERAYERNFALAVIDQAMDRLILEAARTGRSEQLDQVTPLLLEPRDSGAIKSRAAALGMRSNSLAVLVHRWRARLAELVRAELADTVADGAELESELQALREALRAA